MVKGDFEYEEVVLMHTSLEVRLFEQLPLLTAEIALGVAGLKALHASYGVKIEEQQAMQRALQSQSTKALQEAAARERRWCRRGGGLSPLRRTRQRFVGPMWLSRVSWGPCRGVSKSCR